MAITKLHILLIESSPSDAQHALDKLAQSGYQLTHRRVDSAEAMKAALSQEQFEAILCSFDPPGFSGLAALEAFQATGQDLPFLFLSHDLREEAIIHAMRCGADDYIFKGSLNRLVPAIEHNLREAHIRRDHRASQLALQENQTRLHAFIADLPGMAYQILLRKDNSITFPYISEGCLALLGIPAHDLLVDPGLFNSMIHPDDLASYQNSMLHSAQSLSFWNWEGRIKTVPDGEIKWINLRCSPRTLPEGVQWEGIIFNITQSKLSEMEILQSKAQLRELSSHIQDVREQERIAIAREVHDDIGSTLTAIKLEIAWLGRRLQDKAELSEKIATIETLLDKCSTAASNISHSLRPSVLDCFGIIAAIENEANEFERRTGIACLFDYSDDKTPISPDLSIALFRIFQEALANITKHAQASEVDVRIHNGASGVNFSVHDNGKGFSDNDRNKPRSFGLRGIKERVEHFGGSVVVASQPGKGTRIEIAIPPPGAQPSHDEGAAPLPQQRLF